MPDIEIPDPDDVREKAEDPFLKRVALVVAIYAVVLAVGGLGGGNVTEDMIMNQNEATNQWSRYQAKAVREAIYIAELEKIQFDREGGALTDRQAKLADTRIGKIKEKLAEYKTEKEEIAKLAQAAEKERDVAVNKDPYFDLSEVLMQVAIVLASVAMLSGRKWLFAVSLLVAVVGTLLTANGYLLLDGGKFMGK